MPKGRSGQRGISLGELVFFSILIGGAAMTAMRLFPLYNEKMKVDLALDRVAADLGAGNQTKTQIANSLLRQFEVSDVDRWSEQEFMRLLQIDHATSEAGRVVRLEYDIRNTFCCDLDVVLRYHRQVQLPKGNAD